MGINEKKPNILWIMTDQQSANMLSCTGNQWVSTPNLDALAEESVRFDNNYCTNPVCCPSRFSLLTGMYPGDIGVRNNIYRNFSYGVPPAVVENGMGKLLRDQGYTTVYGGKQHLPFTNVVELGFDNPTKDCRDQLADSFAQYLAEYDYSSPLCMVASFINPHDICLMAISDFRKYYDLDGLGNNLEVVYGDAINAVNKAKKIPEGVSEEEFYRDICPPLPDNYQPSEDEPEAISILQEQRRFKKLAREQYTDAQWRLHRWAYANLTNWVDSQIGKLLDALKASDHWDDTLIIFTSDHGDMDASHKMEHKENLYQEACRVPLLIKQPGKSEGRVSDLLVSNGLDLFPTILDYAGAPAPSYLRGKSLRSAVENSTAESLRDVLVIECENGIGAVSKEFKYVLYDKGDRNEQLYNLIENPGEQYDQSADPRYQNVLEMFRQVISQHQNTRPAEFICMKK